MTCGPGSYAGLVLPSRRARQIQESIEAFTLAENALEALAAARLLRERAEALEREQIAAARKEGHSWSKIGGLYGLTKQGAQQRFRPGKSVSEANADPAGETQDQPRPGP